MRAAARDALTQRKTQPENQPRQVAIGGATYTATYVASENLANIDLFEMAARSIGTRSPATRTIIVVGRSHPAMDPNGFILLVGVGHGEDLLDHSCAIAP